MAYTFKSIADIMGIEPPTKSAAIEVWHETHPGFGVRIMKRRQDGKVRRTYISRIDVLQPDGTEKEDKPPLGLVEDIGTRDAVISYRDAEAAALKLVRDAKIRKAGGTVRFTMGDAYAKLEESLASDMSNDSPDYGLKLRKLYARFLAHLAPRYLDELKEGFWADYYRQLRAGKLIVGKEPGKDGEEVPAVRKANSANYAMAILNAASRLYTVAHQYKGIDGEDKGWDPTREAAGEIEAPNVRDTFVQFEHLAIAWAATDQLMSPWWRDMWRVYLLTGLRDRLVMDMRWEQIDFERGLYLIMPLQQGTKRQRRKLSIGERGRPIEMPLSSYVLDILRRRKLFAPNTPAGEWVWYSTETVRRKAKESPRLSDPRTSWQRLIPVIGYWCYKHDLRRTFASLGASVDKSAILSLSLLLLHSSKSIANALGVPQITIEYIKGQQASMRALTEKITQAVLELVGEVPRTELTAGMVAYEKLPDHVAGLLSLEERAPERGLEFAEGDE